MISVVIIEPSIEGNIGAIARAMKNFGFVNLILVNPQCKYNCQEVRNRAKHAQEIIDNIQIRTFEEIIKEFDTIVGTTAKIGTDYNIPRNPIKPNELKLSDKSCILFGRESDGLSNEEIKKCDFVVCIPASSEYPTLNLSHAVTIILYEVSQQNHIKHINLANRSEKDIIMKLLDDTLNLLEFATEGKKETQRSVWKRLIGKSNLTKREAMALCGFLKKIKR